MSPMNRQLEDGGVYSMADLARISPELAERAKARMRDAVDRDIAQAMERLSERPAVETVLPDEVAPAGVAPRNQGWRLGDRLQAQFQTAC